MPLIEIHWNPNNRQLRQFSAICLAAPALLTWWLTHSLKWSVGIGSGGVAVGLAGFWKPSIVRPVFVGLSALTAPIGMVLGECAVLVVYLLVVTPIGVLLRSLGKDPLHKRPAPSQATYWDDLSSTDQPAQYYRQF